MPAPPREIPQDLLASYTLDGSIPVHNMYFNSSKKPNTVVWENEYINRVVNRFTFNNVLTNKHGKETYTGAARFHVVACEKYSSHIKNKDVAVIGSISPWIEAILINAGAKSVTTVEYNVPVCEHNIIKTTSYTDFTISEKQYDAIFSYSSIEHSGLGRYGDPLNPNGDIETMEHIYRSLKVGGLCFLGVPVGKDHLVWNAHRIYGEKRLKLLYLDKFKEMEWIGISKSYISTYAVKAGNPAYKQPLIVLLK